MRIAFHRSFIVVLFLFAGASAFCAEPSALFVAPDGDDGAAGSLEAPFLTLERARQAIREMKAQNAFSEGGVVVNLRGGDYLRNEAFELTEEDSGTDGGRIVYRAYLGESVRLLGAKPITTFGPVTDPAIRERFAESARDSIVQADLTAAGVADYGTLKRRGFGRNVYPAALEVIFDGAPMTLARWPNDEWTNIAEVPGERNGGTFTYTGDRPDAWAPADDIWLHGYWYWDWADSYEQIANLDKATKTITTVEPHGAYGYKPNARFYFRNVLEELDSPGEYYLDRASGILYFWPPAPLEGRDVLVSTLEAPVVRVTGASNISLEGLRFEGGRYCGVIIEGGAHNRIAGCIFANLGNFAANVSGGEDHAILGCDIFNLGDYGVNISGGDRMTLTPAGHVAENNHIHHYGRMVRTYTPALMINGVGNRIAHNLIHDAPHMGIGLGGNDHIIEYNELHHILLETHDAGAFYMGRDWSMRGNVVRFNFFHEMGKGDAQAVYLDDWASGTLVQGNICQGVRRGVLLGGGRDTTIVNNVFVDCTYAIHIDQRGTGWASSYFDGRDTTLFDRLKDVNATGPIYTAKYPELATLLEDEPVLAKHNVIRHNVCVNSEWLSLHNGLTPETGYLHISDNYVGEDPGFVEPEAMNFRLKPGSPAFQVGFKPLPWDSIGLYANQWRPQSRMP